mgnify:CR=1 FL=1
MNSGYMYEVENDIDFFKELKKITHDKSDISSASTSHVTESDTAPRCLITDEKLRKDHIVLECGHKFNYVPLFKEVLFQKCSLLPKNISSKVVTTYTKNSPETSTSQQAHHPTTYSSSSSNANVLSVTYNSSYNLETTKLQYNEMKCPYCRTITPYILPFYPYPDVCKVKYVNTPFNLSLPALPCEYDKFISGGENTIFTTSESGGGGCRSHCTYYDKYDLMLCNKHFNKLEAGVSPSRKTRRKSHSSINSANTADNTDTQNIIISHHNPATTACSFILLSGPRKGALCGKPMWIPKTSTSTSTSAIHDAGLPAYCKAHYNKSMQIQL